MGQNVTFSLRPNSHVQIWRMSKQWETHTDSDTQPRLLSAVPSSILFQDSPSLPREKVIAAEKAEHSVKAANSLA